MAKLDRDNAFYNYQAPPAAPVFDEQRKIQEARAAQLASSPESLAAADASRASRAADADPYTTALVGNTGKTQAQLDAAEGATNTAKMINDLYGPIGITSTVDPKTGKVITKSPTGKILGDPNQTPIGGPNPIVPVVPKIVDDIKNNPAYAALLAAMSAYGIEGLAATLLKIRTDYPDITSEDLLSLLRFDTRYNAGYLKRFAGNAKLAAAGKPTLDEKTYFANEAAYAKIFKAYGVDRFANRDQYATLIGNELAPTEVSTRVGMAYDRVLNADSNVSLALRKYASSLTTGDLVAAMLDPVNQLPELERKITSAEIGGQALNQGLQLSDQARITELVNAKVDREAAMVGYKNIATVLPEATKFGNIYSETGVKYDQSTGEEEYLLNNVAAEKKRLLLKGKELASFDASAGNAPGAYGTGYLKRSSAAGLI
jgi:hypothetical protein